MTVANLRGVKESGRVFAGPTYIYVLALVSLIGVGLYKVYFASLGPIQGAGSGARRTEDHVHRDWSASRCSS